jgi:3-dehydroquinate synthase
MGQVTVDLPGRSYAIDISHGLLDSCGTQLAEFAPRGRLAVLTDETVAIAQLSRLKTAVASANIHLEIITVPPGEASKSWSTLGYVVNQLLGLEMERGETLVALGGGIIGDLGGFAASILKRGMRFVQIPTTLLSQVDSSVGGKTGINSNHGKNLIGAFYQPAWVLIDPTVLDSLPDRHMRAGYAEIVKYGLIDDAEFFAWCEAQGAAVLSRDPAALNYAITHSVSAKARIVAADERETQDVRALLNLGHTFGHALEAETGFSDVLFHGEAVAAGMALAHRFSTERGLCSAADAGRVREHLDAMGLPTGLSGMNASGAILVDHMRHDKKMAGGTLPFILTRGIGQSFVDKSVNLDDVAAFLDAAPR